MVKKNKCAIFFRSEKVHKIIFDLLECLTYSNKIRPRTPNKPMTSIDSRWGKTSAFYNQPRYYYCCDDDDEDD